MDAKPHTLIDLFAGCGGLIEVAQCLGLGVEELICMPEKKEGGE